MSRQRRLKIYFDGGCQPNPGAMEGAVVVRGAGKTGGLYLSHVEVLP